MKRHVALFENFEEAFDDFYSKPDVKSDSFYHKIAKELIELAGQYTESGSQIDMYSEKYATPSRIRDLQNDLIVRINDTMGEQLAEEFMEESDALLNSYEISEAKKKKVDQDGDGDTDFVDAKIAQYKKGGIPKDKAIKKAKLFAKTNNIPDNGLTATSTKNANLEKPTTAKPIGGRPRKTKNPM